jgi:LytR cell envelope-related transcriptional attenuator
MRGALLIAAAVLLGAGLLANGFRDDHSILSSPGSTPTTKKSTTTTPTASTAVQAHDPAQVKVLVLNGSGKAGIAKAGADVLKAANYTTLEPSNAKGGTIATSIVYFVPGYDADAATVTAKLGLPASAAQPLPTPPPAEIADPKDANVIVLVGSDAPIAGGAGAGTTSSTSPTTAPTATSAATATTAAN